MRAPGALGVAVRRPTGEIVVRQRAWQPWACRASFWRWPVLRGVAALGESLQAGFEGMAFATEQAGMHGPLAPAAVGSARGFEPDPAPGRLAALGSFAFALVLGMTLLVVLPHGLAVLLSKLWGGLAVQSLAFQGLASVAKLLVFGAYVGLLGQLPEVRRLFMYHGAEHKVIAAYEAGEPLDVRHAMKYGTFHGRCGTGFLVMFVVLTMGTFALLMPWLPARFAGWSGHAVAMGLKTLLLVPLAGVAYEIHRSTVRRMGRPWAKVLLAPGFWLQRLTMREPTDPMVEVAVAALKAALSGRAPVMVDAKKSSFAYRKFADACARQG